MAFYREEDFFNERELLDAMDPIIWRQIPEVAKLIGENRPNVSWMAIWVRIIYAIAGLESDGLVERMQSDDGVHRSVSLVRLTDAGLLHRTELAAGNQTNTT